MVKIIQKKGKAVDNGEFFGILNRLRFYYKGLIVFKSFSAKPSDIEKKWVLIDASDLVVGRLASVISMILRGKNKPTYTPHIHCGDNIIVVNTDKMKFTGKKQDLNTGKKYYWHTGYAGGIKEVTAGKLYASGKSSNVLFKAVQRMITRGPLGRAQMKNLFIYTGAEHPHAGQQPSALDVGSLNRKNKR
jgi:large subunit ribosomal protein L13